jgi:hypothetical protein
MGLPWPSNCGSLVLGAGLGLWGRRHLLWLLYSRSGIYIWASFPRLFPKGGGYRLGYVRWSLCSGNFQHSSSEDPREKPRSETLPTHLESVYGSAQHEIEGITTHG